MKVMQISSLPGNFDLNPELIEDQLSIGKTFEEELHVSGRSVFNLYVNIQSLYITVFKSLVLILSKLSHFEHKKVLL